MVKVKDLKEYFEEKITDLIFDTHREIILNTPVDTGRLRSSIKVEGNIDEGFIIGTNVEYAPYVEMGTGIYGKNKRPIIPKKAKALHWKDRKGKDIFAKKVKGYKGFNMFLKGVQYFENNLNNLIKE